MPGGNSTGPAGMGPMTGRAAGFCAGYPAPGFVTPARGRGSWGGGRSESWGNGCRHGYWYRATGLTGWQRAQMGWPAYQPSFTGPFSPVMTKKQELDALSRQAEYFEHALEDVRKRIEKVESRSGDLKTT